MAVDDKMVLRVAGLARLKLEAAEVPHLTGELNSILGWIDQLQAVDTGDVQPMNAVIPLMARRTRRKKLYFDFPAIRRGRS